MNILTETNNELTYIYVSHGCLMWLILWLILIMWMIAKHAKCLLIICSFFNWLIINVYHYKKCDFLEGPTWLNVHINQGGWSFLLKAWGMKVMSYFWLWHLTKMTFSTMWQIKHLVKKARCPSIWLRLSQIDHYDLTLNQIKHINLVI
jgi:hypothetical protein